MNLSSNVNTFFLTVSSASPLPASLHILMETVRTTLLAMWSRRTRSLFLNTPLPRLNSCQVLQVLYLQNFKKDLTRISIKDNSEASQAKCGQMMEDWRHYSTLIRNAPSSSISWTASLIKIWEREWETLGNRLSQWELPFTLVQDMAVPASHQSAKELTEGGRLLEFISNNGELGAQVR